MGKTLFQKVFDAHEIKVMHNGQSQLLIGLHLLHEVTSPQAFGMLRERGLKVAYPSRTFATVDHVIPTDEIEFPWEDKISQEMYEAIRENTKANGITFFGPETGGQGVIHVIAPEHGLTQPGMTVSCGDSHTATHGAFGTLAFGIGTTQVRDVLATQTMLFSRLKLRRINVTGKLQKGVYAKDVILHIIRKLGVKGGVGYAYEYGGPVIEAMSMDERMTICNMSIEGGARVGYINPDETTFEYLRGREYAPKPEEWDAAVQRWNSFRSDPDADYDDVVNFDAGEIKPTVTWGINPAQAIFINEPVPDPAEMEALEAQVAADALEYMKLEPGQPVKGKPVDVVFIGSCTNGRISDFRAVAKALKSGSYKVRDGVRALAVPGSQMTAKQAEEEGIPEIFRSAGFDWRKPGCSMCLAMNPDKLVGDQLSASTSNRNFKGRQGSPTGRTVLMSPVMAAAAAVTGEISDAREVFGL